MDINDCKPKKDRADELDPDLLAHIRSLGLSAVEDYVSWCAKHGFSRRTNKHWRKRLKERAYAGRAVARLARKKQEIRKPAKIIDKIFNGELHEDYVTEPHLKVVCRACQSAQESRWTRLFFSRPPATRLRLFRSREWSVSDQSTRLAGRQHFR